MGFRKMEICLDVQLEIDRGQIKSSVAWAISISEVLNALATEPGESKILPCFYGTKGAYKPKYSRILEMGILISFISQKPS